MSSKTNRTDATPYSQEDVDSLQMMRSSPILYLRTVLLQFIQGLFWYMPRGNYHWEPNVGETEIFITDESPMKVKEYGSRPGITITRAPIVFNSLGMDDMVSFNMATNTKKKSVIVPGNMALNCCSREPIESENLAFFLAEQLWLLRDILQKKSIYQIGQNIGVGAPSPAGSLVQADQGDEWTVTTAGVPFQLIRTGAVTPLGQRVAQAVSLSLSRQGGGSFMPPTGESPMVFQPSRVRSMQEDQARSAQEQLHQPGVETTPQIVGKPRPPGIRGRPIPLRGSGVGES